MPVVRRRLEPAVGGPERASRPSSQRGRGEFGIRRTSARAPRPSNTAVRKKTATCCTRAAANHSFTTTSTANRVRGNGTAHRWPIRKDIRRRLATSSTSIVSPGSTCHMTTSSHRSASDRSPAKVRSAAVRAGSATLTHPHRARPPRKTQVQDTVSDPRIAVESVVTEYRAVRPHSEFMRTDSGTDGQPASTTTVRSDSGPEQAADEQSWERVLSGTADSLPEFQRSPHSQPAAQRNSVVAVKLCSSARRPNEWRVHDAGLMLRVVPTSAVRSALRAGIKLKCRHDTLGMSRPIPSATA